MSERNPMRPDRPQVPKSDASERYTGKKRRPRNPNVRRSRWVSGDDADQGGGVGPFNREPPGRRGRRPPFLVIC